MKSRFGTRTAALAAMAIVWMWLARPAAAQTPAPAPPVLVFRDTVVVTAERGEAPQSWIPAATVSFDRAALAGVPAVSVGEFISFVPGFRVQQSGFHAGRPVVSARGFFGGGEAEYVALLVDGIRVADAESGLVEWSTMAGSATTRIEAARGPGASLYGDAAIGGVIQVFTDSPSTGEVVTVSGGSLATFSADGTWRWKTDTVTGLVSGAGRRTNGISDHSDASEATFGSAINGTLRALSWRWTAGVVGRDQEDPGVLTIEQRESGVTFDPLFGDDERQRRSVSTAFSIRGAGATWRHQSRVSLERRDEDGIRTILLAPGVGDTRSRDLATGGVGGSVEIERSLGATPNSALRIGVDLERQHLDSRYFNVVNGEPVGGVVAQTDGARLRAGAFASSSWMPASRLRLFGALRWDRIDDTDFEGAEDEDPTQAWSPRAGVVVQPPWLGGASVFAQYSRAFKAPTLDQRFDPRPYPDFRGGTFTISNPLLTAQRASNIEAGVNGGGSTLHWSALAYRMAVENEIDFDVRTFSYANIGRSRHTGIELEAQGQLASGLRPLASYSLSDVADADASVDRQLKNVPRHQLMVGASAKLPWKVETFASARRVWGAYLDDENAFPIASGVLVDLRVRRPIGRADLFADLLNATDRRYDEFGFVLADFRGGQVPYVYPGQPRVFRVGVTIGAR